MFSLLAQHGDFDNIREEDAAVGDEIDSISEVRPAMSGFPLLLTGAQDSIHDYAFETLLSMHQDNSLARMQPIILNCLGMHAGTHCDPLLIPF